MTCRFRLCHNIKEKKFYDDFKQLKSVLPRDVYAFNDRFLEFKVLIPSVGRNTNMTDEYKLVFMCSYMTVSCSAGQFGYC